MAVLLPGLFDLWGSRVVRGRLPHHGAIESKIELDGLTRADEGVGVAMVFTRWAGAVRACKAVRKMGKVKGEDNPLTLLMKSLGAGDRGQTFFIFPDYSNEGVAAASILRLLCSCPGSRTGCYTFMKLKTAATIDANLLDILE